MEKCKAFFRNPKNLKIVGIATGSVVLVTVLIVALAFAGGGGSSGGGGAVTTTGDVENKPVSGDEGDACDDCKKNPCECSIGTATSDPDRRFSISDGDPLIVIDLKLGKPIEPENIIINKDGTITVTTEDGETFTLKRPAAATTVPPDDQTGTATPDGSGTGATTSSSRGGPTTTVSGSTGTTPPTTASGNTTTQTTTAPFKGISLNGKSASVGVGGVTIDESKKNLNGVEVRIVSAGTYVVTGTLNDGQIVIDTEGKVNLILRNANITCSDGPAIRTSRDMERGSGTLTITCEQGTNNSVKDGRKSRDEIRIDDEEERDARNGAIFSRADLIINGSGKLNITGGYLHGINSRETIEISGANVSIKSAGNGLRSRIEMKISNNADVTINAGNKGMRAAGNRYGHIEVVNSKLKIISVSDAVHASANIIIVNSTIDITTDGGYKTPPTPESSKRGLRSSNDDENIAAGNISVTGGTMTLNCSEDAVNTSGSLTISGATMTVLTSRRALRGRENMTIKDSTISIPYCRDALRVGGKIGRMNISNTSMNVKSCNVGLFGAFIEVTNGNKVNIHAASKAVDYKTSYKANPAIGFSYCDSSCKHS